MIATKSKNYTYFIGIDISRNKLDYAIMYGKALLYHREAENHPDSINLLVQEFKLLPKFVMTRAIFCMEQTGIYSNHALATLKKAKANIVIESALHIRNSLGVIRGKYDKIDAIRIANYAYKNRDQLRLWTAKRPIVEQLAHLSSLRLRMVEIQGKITTPLGEQKEFIKKQFHKTNSQLCVASMNAIRSDLETIDQSMIDLINGDENLRWLMEIVTSIPCVGPVTAMQILITTNEFKDIRCPKKFACYAGVAPFKRDSGTVKVRAKVSSIANKRVKALLHICAVGAIRHNKEIRVYFERKTLIEGKPKMSVINAVRYKLILRIFACVSQNRVYQKEYIRTDENTLMAN